MATVPKGRPTSIRLDPATQALVDAEAKRVQRSRSAVIESLTAESARVRRFPGIGFRGDDFGRRPWVVGTNLDVWELCQMLDQHSSDAELLDAFDNIQPRHLALARAYRKEFTQEIDEAIAGNSGSLEELLERFHFLVVDES